MSIRRAASWKLDHELYSYVLKGWLEQPNARALATKLNLPHLMVAYLRDNGIPELSLAPLRGIKQSNKARAFKAPPPAPDSGEAEKVRAQFFLTYEEAQRVVEEAKRKFGELRTHAQNVAGAVDVIEEQQELAGIESDISQLEQQLNLEAKRLANVEQRAIVSDNVKKSAGEAALARQTMNSALNLGAIYDYCITKLLDAVQTGNVELPKVVDARLLVSLANALDRLTTSIERAIKIAKGRAGERDESMSVNIAVLLDQCSDREMEEVAASGRLPARFYSLGSGRSSSNVIPAEVEETDDDG